MTNIPIDLREKLEALLLQGPQSTKLKPDGTIKLQIELFDGHCIETVLLIDADKRKTAVSLVKLVAL